MTAKNPIESWALGFMTGVLVDEEKCTRAKRKNGAAFIPHHVRLRLVYGRT